MATPHHISTLLGDTAQWDSHAPAYGPLMVLMGHVAPATQSSQADAPRLLINLTQRSPFVVAFVVKGDEDHVHVGHSPTMYPADPTSVSPLNNLVIILLGNDVDSTTGTSGFFLPSPHQHPRSQSNRHCWSQWTRRCIPCPSPGPSCHRGCKCQQYPGLSHLSPTLQPGHNGHLHSLDWMLHLVFPLYHVPPRPAHQC